MRTGFPHINLRERDHLKDLGVDVWIMVKTNQDVGWEHGLD